MNANLPENSDDVDELQRQMDRSSQWLRSLYQWNPNGVFALDRKGCFVALNPACERIMGYAPEELLGRHFFEVTPEKSRDAAFQAYSQALAGGCVRIRMEGLARDGSVRTMDVSIAPLPVESGIGGALVMAHDVTQRLQAEAQRDDIESALRASEERYQAFISQSAEAIWRLELREPVPVSLAPDAQIDEFYRVASLAECNDAFAQIYGFARADEVIGASLQDTTPDTPINREFMRAFIANDYHIVDAESREIDRHGNTIYVSNNFVGIIENGFIQRVWGTQRDVTEKRTTAAAVRASEERYRAFIAQSSEAIWRYELIEPISLALPLDDIIDLVYERAVLAECNDEMARIYGCDRAEQVIGKKLTELVPRTPHNEGQLRAFAASGWRLDNKEMSRTERDGRTSHYVASLLGIVEDGYFLRAWGMRRDITARKEAEYRLRHSERRLQLALRAGQLGTWDWDGKQNTVRCSPLALTIFGLDTSHAIMSGEEVLTTIHREDYERVVQAMRDSLASGELLEIDYRVVWPDGSLHWISAVGTRVVSSSGASGMAGTCRDITPRRRRERHQAIIAEASQAFTSSLDLDTTLRNVAHLLVPAHADWCVIDLIDTTQGDGANSTMPRNRHVAVAHVDATKEHFLWGMRSLGESDGAFDLNLNQDSSETIRPIHLAHGAEENLRELWPDDAQRAAMRAAGLNSLMCIPLCARGRTLGIITIATARPDWNYDKEDLALAEDLARRAALAVDNARLYGEAEAARRDAEAANRAKDDFLAIVSHELRTPLTPLLGWIDLINSKRLDAAQIDRAHEAIGRNAHTQLQLVNDLLDVSRIISGKLLIESQQLDWRTPVADAVESVHPDAVEKHISLRWNAPPEAVWIQGDANRLRQVAANLLLNAIKFTPVGGTVEIALSTVDFDRTPCVQLEVSDSGIGIAPEFLPHVWERFRQADVTTTRNHGGLGLGLAIVHHIVMVHGGEVEAASCGVGQGARFQVRLPLSAATPELLDAPRFAAEIEAHRRAVLLVDDEEDAREVLAEMLLSRSFEVRVASSCEEAFEILAVWKPNAIISDLSMPDSDGYAFLRRLQTSEFCAIPVLALTAHAREEDRQSALDAGYDGYLAKPVEAGELLQAISNLIAL